jgi:branched-chain amino acid aminotransferase
MGIESEHIWFDGRLVPFADARVHVLSHTLHYGLGGFEGIRAYPQDDGSHGIWRLRDHLIRLRQTMEMVRTPLPYDLDVLEAAHHEVLRANGMNEAYLRPLAFLGMGAMGLGARGNPVHVVIAAWRWGAYMGEAGLQAGIRLRTSSFHRNHPNAALPRAKVVGHYVNSILARYEANDDGYDEALLLDGSGLVAEGTGENVFAVHGGVVRTPPLTHVLGGITRQTAIELLNAEGIPVQEASMGRDALYTADEVFLTGTAAEVTPVAELDRRRIGPPGPVTRMLQRRYAEAVRGRDPSMRHHVARDPSAPRG